MEQKGITLLYQEQVAGGGRMRELLATNTGKTAQ
jgi:hypothetical protein